jgi:rod shape-determining protein MreD
MTRKNSLILLILFFALLQVSVLHYFRLFGVKPDLFLICVVVVSLYFEVEYALLISFLCGVLKDIFSISPFGLNTFLLPVISFLVMKISRKLALDNTPVICAAVFLLAVLYDILSRIALGYLGTVVPFWAFLRITLLESLYTAAIFPLTFKLFKRVVHLS